MEILFSNNILNKIEKIGHIYPDAFKILLTNTEWEQFINELEQNHHIDIDDKKDLLSQNYLEYNGIGIERPY